MVKYEVFGVLDDEIIEFCEDNNIDCSENIKICCFVGEKKDLEKLHNEFFDEYKFNVEEVD